MNQGGCYRFIHNAATSLKAWCSRKLAGNDIGRNVRIALHAYIDLTNPRGVHIGDGTLIETGAIVLAHDPTRHFHTNTYVGRNCFIGIRALIMPGVKIGDQSIILPGSVVESDVPPGSMVVGNPARIVRSGIRTDKYGLLLDDGVDARIAEPREYPDISNAWSQSQFRRSPAPSFQRPCPTGGMPTVARTIGPTFVED